MLKEFRDFLLRGNIVELAIAFVLGVAFGALITSFVDNLLMPVVAMIIGKPDFRDLTFTINDSVFRYGAFLTDVISFVAVAAAIFFFNPPARNVGRMGPRVNGNSVPVRLESNVGTRDECPKAAMDRKPRQRIRYLRTRDGVQLAWAEAGQGPSLVKAANWLCHLEYEWESPVWGHWVRFFSERFRFVRYDERGCGMTDWKVDDLSCDRWVEDLEAVVDASGVAEPFALIGVSQGCAVCISYAVRHPERVSRMVLYGGYDRGFARRNDSAGEREYRAIVELCRSGWGRDNPAFRQIFTSRFVPGATDAQLEWFNELCRRTSAPEIAARLLEARANVEVSELVPQVTTPTLVIHANEDQVVSVRQGRRLASRIPGAQYVELDSKNHVLLEHEPAWERFKEAVADFLGVGAPPARGVFDSLSAREREILALITEGLANAEIAERLSISDKTVRNHVSNLFDKLGIGTRAQAMVFARDHGFRS